MIATSDFNRPDVVAELQVLFQDYERALVANDVEALQRFFWSSPLALRFGSTEELYGSVAIDEFRKNRVVNFSGRKSLRQQLVTLGSDLGIATLEFSAKVEGVPRHGRQSQVWVRFAGLGWRIVSAHVSFRAESVGAFDSLPLGDYLASMSRVTRLRVPAAHAEEVIQNLRVMAVVAGPLMEFALPDAHAPEGQA